MEKINSKLYSLIALVFVITFVLANHIVYIDSAAPSFNFNESIVSSYNITVQNNDSDSLANITQVNITLPSTFTFITNSNSTDTGNHTFSNTTNILIWEYLSVNESLVMNLTNQTFFFNASASTPGTYNIIVTTTNASNLYNTNLAVTINDTNAPTLIAFVAPGDGAYANISQGNIAINASVTDNGTVDTITINVYNSTFDNITVYNSSNSASLFANISVLGSANGVYYVNVTANDTYGNEANSSTITINIDNVNHTVTLVAPADNYASTNITQNFTFTVSSLDPISSCILVLNDITANTITATVNDTNLNITNGTNGIYNSTLTGVAPGTAYTWYINCTDNHGNTVNSSRRQRVLTVAAAATTTTTTTSGGGGGASPILKPSEAALIAGYQVSIPKNWKIQFKKNDETHTITIGEVLPESVTITIASVPQEATLSIGEEKKFDVNGDNIYDLSVSLESIVGSKAGLIVKSISEEKPAEVIAAEEAAAAAATDEDKTSLTWLWVLIAVVIVLAIAGVLYKKRK